MISPSIHIRIFRKVSSKFYKAPFWFRRRCRWTCPYSRNIGSSDRPDRDRHHLHKSRSRLSFNSIFTNQKEASAGSSRCIRLVVKIYTRAPPVIFRNNEPRICAKNFEPRSLQKCKRDNLGRRLATLIGSRPYSFSFFLLFKTVSFLWSKYSVLRSTFS